MVLHRADRAVWSLLGRFFPVPVSDFATDGKADGDLRGDLYHCI